MSRLYQTRVCEWIEAVLREHFDDVPNRDLRICGLSYGYGGLSSTWGTENGDLHVSCGGIAGCGMEVQYIHYGVSDRIWA